MLLLGTTRLLIFKNFSCQHIYKEQKFSWMLRKSQILSTLHQFPSKMYITYLPSHIHTIFKRFSPPTCLLDFTFCPSSMFIPSNMFIRFCLFALPTLLFHPTRLLGTLEYLLDFRLMRSLDIFQPFFKFILNIVSIPICTRFVLICSKNWWN